MSVLESPPSLSVPLSLIPHSTHLVSISVCTSFYVWGASVDVMDVNFYVRPRVDKQYLETAAKTMAELADLSTLSEEALRRRREYDATRRLGAEEAERY